MDEEVLPEEFEYSFLTGRKNYAIIYTRVLGTHL